MATLRAGDLTPQSLGKPRALRRAVAHPFPRSPASGEPRARSLLRDGARGSPGAGARDHGGRWVGGNGGPLTLHHGRSLASGRVQRGPPWLPGDPSGGSAAAPSATGGRHALKRARARRRPAARPLPRFFRGSERVPEGSGFGPSLRLRPEAPGSGGVRAGPSAHGAVLALRGQGDVDGGPEGEAGACTPWGSVLAWAESWASPGGQGRLPTLGAPCGGPGGWEHGSAPRLVRPAPLRRDGGRTAASRGRTREAGGAPFASSGPMDHRLTPPQPEALWATLPKVSNQRPPFVGPAGGVGSWGTAVDRFISMN